MKNGGIDKRVVKTKNAIFDAFKQLVQQKDMADISISELTQKANITRSTFYMYYDTVGDVRSDIENEIVARIDKIMSEADLLNSMTDPYPLSARWQARSPSKTVTIAIFCPATTRGNSLTKSTKDLSPHTCISSPR